jgi:flagellar protein FlaI
MIKPRIESPFRIKLDGKREKEKIQVDFSSSPPLPEPPLNAVECYDVDGAKVAITPNRYVLLQPEIPNGFEKILKEVIFRFSISQEGRPEDRLMRAFLSVAMKRKIPPDEARNYWYHLYNFAFRAGRITPLLSDPNVEDIACSGANKPVFVFHSKYGYIPTNLVFSESELVSFVHSLVQKTGATLSYDSPIADATLYDGSRLNATISISREASFVIRKSKKIPLTPKMLIDKGTWTPEIAALLWLALESRCSLMFIGATASGKTTAMNAAAFFIPPHSRIVSIEDTFELWLPHENWTAMITKGGITQLDLLKAALRQRPEYIIVGEARGVEVREMFTAMGTGHTTLTTFHGGDVMSVLRRLTGETLGIKHDQLMLLDFIITLSLVGTRRICTSVTMISSEGEQRLLGPLFGTDVACYSVEEGAHRIDRLAAALDKISQKSLKPKKALRDSFEEKVNTLQNAPADYLPFKKYIARLGGGA